MGRVFLSLFGVGFVPGMPGTYASAVTALALWITTATLGVGAVPAGCFALVLGSAVTLAFATRTLLATGDGDPSWVVTDEVAGMGAAFAIAALVPRGPVAPLVASFLLFRVFDVWKPGPIGMLERLPGAVGVLADDLAAGAVAGGIVLAAEALGLLQAPLLGW